MSLKLANFIRNILILASVVSVVILKFNKYEPNMRV